MDDNQERKDFSSSESDLQLSVDEETLLDQLGISGAARRKFLGQSMAALLGTFAFNLLAKEESFATFAASPDALFAPTPGAENAVQVLLKINGLTQTSVLPRTQDRKKRWRQGRRASSVASLGRRSRMESNRGR